MASERTPGTVTTVLPRLRSCVRVSQSLDGERALLNPGTGTVIVLDEQDYRALSVGDAVSGALLDELARAGFLERNA